MGLGTNYSNRNHFNTLEMSYYKLKVPAGSYEADSLPRHAIESGGLDHRVPVGSRVGIGLVVRDAKQNIWRLGRGQRAKE